MLYLAKLSNASMSRPWDVNVDHSQILRIVYVCFLHSFKYRQRHTIISFDSLITLFYRKVPNVKDGSCCWFKLGTFKISPDRWVWAPSIRWSSSPDKIWNMKCLDIWDRTSVPADQEHNSCDSLYDSLVTAYLLYVPADHGEGEALKGSGVVLEERMGYNIIPGWVIILSHYGL